MLAFTRNFGRNAFQPAERDENDNGRANGDAQFKDITLNPRHYCVPIILEPWNDCVWLNAFYCRYGFCCHILCVSPNAPLNNLSACDMFENWSALRRAISAPFAIAANGMSCGKGHCALWSQSAARTPIFTVTILFTIFCYSIIEPLKPPKAWLISRTDHA